MLNWWLFVSKAIRCYNTDDIVDVRVSTGGKEMCSTIGKSLPQSKVTDDQIGASHDGLRRIDAKFVAKPASYPFDSRPTCRRRFAIQI
jgi:hypothetical protein